LDQLRMAKEEYRIVNELLASGSFAAKSTSKTQAAVPRNDRRQVSLLSFACQPELMHFFKHRREVEPLLRQIPVEIAETDLEGLIAGKVTPKEAPLLLTFAGDPFPDSVKAPGDGFAALARYVRDGGALLVVNVLPFGRPMERGTDGQWRVGKNNASHWLFRTSVALPGGVKKGCVYLKTALADLPEQVVLPAYSARDYRILDEKAVRASGWEITPLSELWVETDGQKRRLGISAALLHGHRDLYAKGAIGWIDPQALRQMRNVWRDSFTPMRTGNDPRQHDRSDAAQKLVQFTIDNIRRGGQLRQMQSNIDGEIASARAALREEKQRYEDLMTAATAANNRKIPAKKLTVRDGMFCVDGRPKILWGTEISGYAGQGGNGVTSPLGKFYSRAAAQLFGFDYAVLTLFPVLRSYEGKINPKIAPGSGMEKRDWRGEIRSAVREAGANGWPLELNAVFFSYNEFIRKPGSLLMPGNSNYSLVGCPEKEETWKIAEKLYQEAFDDLAEAEGNLNVIELDNESLYLSYSEENRRDFRIWLAKKYRTIEALRTRWGIKKYQSFDEIEPPALRRTEAVKHGIAPIVDWLKFQRERYSAVMLRKRKMIESMLPGRKMLFSIQPFATLSGGEHRHSYAMRGCDYERMPEVAEVLASERLFTPLRAGVSPEEMPLIIGNPGYLFTEMMRSVSENRLPIVNTEGAMVKYGEKKTAAEYQLAVWAHIIHGDQAVVPTYWCFFPAADSVCHPANNEPDVLAALAGIGKSLNRYGELVAPVPRLRGSIAQFVSFESMCDIRRGFNLETEFYAGVFSRRPLDLVTGRQILRGKLKSYRALLLTGAHLVDEEVFAEIQRYVREGGIVLATPETFRGDEYGKPLASGDFFPLAVSNALLDRPLSEIGLRGKEGMWGQEKLAFRFVDKAAQLRAGSRALAQDQDNRPLLAVRSLGKGRVYQLGGEPTAACYLRVFKAILDQENVAPVGELAGAGGQYFVELQVVERKEGFLLFLGNYHGNPLTVEVPARHRLASGNYSITSLLDSREVKTAAGSRIWTGKPGDRLKIALPAHGCEVLFFRKQ
ncbi:MAG: beta-galactosidase, partial [Victivallaceae bacterium]|nr:beta-galactosidase [Victivallaceae bacterium]